MSVINKMLRDLDQRSASTLDPALRAGTRMAAKPATISSHHVSRTPAVLWGLAGLLLLVLGLAAWWWPPLASTSSLRSADANVSRPAESSAAAVPQAPASAESAPQTVLAIQAPASAPTVVALPEAPATVKTSQVAPPPEPAPKTANAKGETGGLKLISSTHVSLSAVTPPSTSANATPAAALPAPASLAPDPTVAAQRQQNATREVLAQAQGLFSAGSADAAIQLLQDSLQTAERANPPAPVATQMQLVRELARMELAQGRASAVLELLSRMEPLLAGQPELWAVRANAAQRLGRHQEAVQFYYTALQSRPAEQRWLLGGAVSQAALGQLAAAAELTEKARAIAPVSNEVLTYLRQQGVILRDKP